MKYIENLSLENLTKIITNYELGGGLVINGRIGWEATKPAILLGGAISGSHYIWWNTFWRKDSVK